MEQMDETTHKALLLSKVLWVWIFSWLVWLVLYQCGHQVQDGVHLEEQRVQHLTDTIYKLCNQVRCLHKNLKEYFNMKLLKQK